MIIIYGYIISELIQYYQVFTIICIFSIKLKISITKFRFTYKSNTYYKYNRRLPLSLNKL